MAASRQSGPKLELARINLREVIPRQSAEHWPIAEGQLMPCSKCVLPTSDVVSTRFVNITWYFHLKKFLMRS